LRIEPVWTPGLGQLAPRSWWIRDLRPGEARRVSFTVEVTDRFVRERYRDGAPEERMLAFRARVWQAPEWPRSAHAFCYWKADRTGFVSSASYGSSFGVESRP
jgi:hypothetical protein